MERLRIIEGWLAVATRDLCPAAKERIALEITAHFDEAVATHVAEGMAPTRAEQLSLSDLGNPEAARRRFKRNHLTILEQKRLERWATKSQSNLPVLFEILAFLIFSSAFIVSVYEREYDQLLNLSSFYLVFSKRIARFALRNTQRSKEYLDRIILLDWLHSIVLILLLSVMLMHWIPRVAPAFSILSFLMVLYSTSRLRQKAMNDRLDLT